ncbi:HEAT repeat domain-containing protein [Actinopolymorpha sp. NPDC004070]|uniref:HEAT repeat domain-containing protein n=1 Tax=Actinopolymorpha sp. NPDC004070 TaxID=3154548 RepID=UPI0033BA6418
MDARQSPREHVRQARARYGTLAVVQRCVALLRGADPAGEEEFLRMLGFRGELAWLLREPNPYWARVWAARALRYCWDDLAAAGVVRGLHDEAWRVVEHCAALAGDHELADAAPTLVDLTEHPVPRVRAAAARALATVAEREHLPALLRLRDDPERNVRTAAERAVAVLRDRLDLDPDPYESSGG